MNHKISISKLIKGYLLLMFIYITFETPILNILDRVSHSLLPIARYGIEALGYFLLVIALLTRSHVAKLEKFDWMIVGTIAISLLSTLINQVDLLIFIIGFRYLLRYLYVYMLVRFAYWNERDYQKAYSVLRIVMAIQLMLIVWQLVHRASANVLLFPSYENIIDGFSSVINTVESRWAVYGSLGRYNLLGYFCVLAIWYWIADREIKKERKNLFMIVVWMAILVISFSRQTIVGIFGAYVFYIFTKKHINWKHIAIISGVLLVVVVLIINAAGFVIGSDYTSTGIGVVTGSIYDRYVSMFSLKFLKIDYEGYGRTWFITEGIRRLLSARPLLGFGLGMYGCPDTKSMAEDVYRMLNIPTTYYMDVYLGCLLGQIGLIGTILYLLSYYEILKKAKKVFSKGSNKEDRRIAIITYGTVLSALIMMFFSSSLCNRVMAYYMWLSMGMFTVRFKLPLIVGVVNHRKKRVKIGLKENC